MIVACLSSHPCYLSQSKLKTKSRINFKNLKKTCLVTIIRNQTKLEKIHKIYKTVHPQFMTEDIPQLMADAEYTPHFMADYTPQFMAE